MARKKVIQLENEEAQRKLGYLTVMFANKSPQEIVAEAISLLFAQNTDMFFKSIGLNAIEISETFEKNRKKQETRS